MALVLARLSHPPGRQQDRDLTPEIYVSLPAHPPPEREGASPCPFKRRLETAYSNTTPDRFAMKVVTECYQNKPSGTGLTVTSQEGHEENNHSGGGASARATVCRARG